MEETKDSPGIFCLLQFSIMLEGNNFLLKQLHLVMLLQETHYGLVGLTVKDLQTKILFIQIRLYIHIYVYVYGEGGGTPLQYSCLENPMDGGAWWAAVHGVTKSRSRLSDFIFTFHFHALEKEMATHSSVLAQRIPGMGEPGGLPSMGSHRIGHD